MENIYYYMDDTDYLQEKSEFIYELDEVHGEGYGDTLEEEDPTDFEIGFRNYLEYGCE